MAVTVASNMGLETAATVTRWVVIVPLEASSYFMSSKAIMVSRYSIPDTGRLTRYTTDEFPSSAHLFHLRDCTRHVSY